MQATASTFRPRHFHEICGQEEALEALRIKLRAYQKTGNTVGHILFTGFSGAGKTTMASVMANEMGVGFQSVMGTRIGHFDDIRKPLLSIKQGDIFFIDEIHALSSRIQEELYSVMEDFKYTWSDKYSFQTRSYPIPRFTLIGATTHTGMLNAPLLSRFQSHVELVPYTHSQLSGMVQGAAARIYGIHLSPFLCLRLARLCRRTARQSYNLLKNLMEVAEATSQGAVRSEDLTDALFTRVCRINRIDPLIGLDAASRRYLTALLRERQPLGLKALSSMINEQEVTISSMIEPFLLTDIEIEGLSPEGIRRRYVGPFIHLTKRGRVATEVAEVYMRECQRFQQEGWFGNESLAF